MSVQTQIASFDDFHQWEQELSPTYRPTKAAQRRANREVIDRGLGINRHRRYDRREI